MTILVGQNKNEVGYLYCLISKHSNLTTCYNHRVNYMSLPFRIKLVGIYVYMLEGKSDCPDIMSNHSLDSITHWQMLSGHYKSDDRLLFPALWKAHERPNFH